RMYIKTMSPEQLFDSIVTVVGSGKGGFGAAGVGKKGPPVGPKGAGPRTQFINFFRVDEGAGPLQDQDGLPQALRMMNSPLLNDGGKALEEAMKPKTPAQAIDYLYLVTLSRHPSAQENDRLLGYVKKQGTPRSAYSDILWSLLNSSEFRLNH